MRYAEIAKYYRDKIALSKLVPGDRLPTNDQMREEHGASQSTITAALRMLTEEGLISARRGAGTVVLKRPNLVITGPQRWERFHNGGAHLIEGEESTQRTAAIVPAPPEVARILKIETHSDVVRRTRVFTQDRKPTCYASSWIHPRALTHVPELTDSAWLSRFWQTLYTERTGSEIAPSPALYGSRNLEDAEREALGAPAGPVPVLVTHTTFQDEEGTLEFWEDVCAPGIWMSRG